MSFLDIIWPDFKNKDYAHVEVAYIVCNDPDEEKLHPSFYKEIAQALAIFWQIQLENLYPHGDWTIEIRDDPEMTVEAHICSR